MTCKQCITIACVTGNKNIAIIRHRLDVRKEDIKSKIDKINETKQFRNGLKIMFSKGL